MIEPSARPSHPRYEIRRAIGEGGMGIVYEAYDRDRQALVALKTVREPSSGAASRLKNEFRALADVAHPNLVSLYELVADDDQLFFTMELIDGVGLTDYVWRRATGPGDGSASGTLSVNTGGAWSSRVHQPDPRPALDLRRLRVVARQLALGVHGLHEAGLLHRDLKPSNVMVTAGERVVLLDFGLVIEFDESLAEENRLVGTAAYMSPEQGARLPLGPASDWYSLGCVLYVALTGRPPYLGAGAEVLVDKQRFPPPPPREIADDVPEDLDALVVELLRRDPSARPSAREILRRLGATVTAPYEVTASIPEAPSLVGREAELEQLRRALRRARAGECVVARVRGTSGTGKSALLRGFLDHATRTGATVLGGRCYERESLPFKAVDALIEQLADHLASLPDDEVREILPDDARLAARVFPALARLDALSDAAGPRRGVPFEQRRRAFVAMRRLIGNLARRRTLVLYVDDLQWGDADSAPLIDELLQPPDSPPLLMVLAFRTGAAETSPLVRRLRNRDGVDVEVGALPDSDARTLAEALLDASGMDAADAADIAAEAAGHPFFIQELVRFAHAGRVRSRDPLTLERVIAGRVASLPGDARRFLETVAIAGRPTPIAVVADAAGIPGRALPRAVNTLRAAQLVRSGGSSGTDDVEPYHDRIGETLVDLLDEDTARATHRALARALLETRAPDAEALARHFAGAGDRARAVAYTLEAAEVAASSLAFDRAAALYERALSEGSFEREHERELRERLGDALANAGLGARSANAYLAATEGAGAEHALALRRRAAEQNLYSGHLERGLELLGGVLADAGFRLSATPRRALWRLLWLRARLRLRGLRFRRRSSQEVPPRDLIRSEVCRVTATGLGMSDFVRASEFQTRALLLALDAGEPGTVGRSLAFEIVISACAGPRGEARNRLLLSRLDRLADGIDDVTTQAWRLAAHASFAFNFGRFEQALEHAEAAVALMRERVQAVWEINSEQLFAFWSLYFLGRWRQLGERLREATAEAAQRGDLYSGANFRTGVFNTLLLARDRPDRARADLDDAMRPWPDRYFHLQHYWEVTARCQLALYEGRAEEAWLRIHASWRHLRRAMHMRIAIVRGEAIHLRARTALALAATGGAGHDVAGLVREARADARRLDRERAGWTSALAELVRASAHAIEGHAHEARDGFDRAAVALEAVDMAMYACAARLRLEAYDIDASRSRDAMRAEGVVDPDAMTRVLAP